MSRAAAYSYWHLSVCAWSARHLRVTELLERWEVLEKLLDEDIADEVVPCESQQDPTPRESDQPPAIRSTEDRGEDAPPYVEFIPVGLQDKWVFTIGDPDSRPSVPHGHLESKKNRHPKLNPYVGRAFLQDRSEDIPRRLNKRELVVLWSNEGFRAHCSDQIGWFMAREPNFDWKMDNPLSLPRPWRRYSNWRKYYQH